ncbi:serine hydrolase domain-containing protein [Paenibacillus sp. GCM10028914]|uniref:serine hydrolase domain-containing protein n=1 Tax=Paenibacillus sp. GCM10028914 TaxID=3273416 RepID=UPI0036188824
MNHPSVLPRCTPEHQGISSDIISRFLDMIHEQGIELHSFMALRGGYIIAEGWWEPYREDLPHMMFSLSKSFTSTAIGLAVHEGLLSLDDKVISFFPEELPNTVSEHLEAMTLRHLLMMGTGHDEDPLQKLSGALGENSIEAFLQAPVTHEPGTHFVYNNGATYMAGAILQKLTGGSLIDYLQPRIFEPLGIMNATWEKCPLGYDCGGWGLSIKTEDIAKFGQLYLQHGQWKGEQLIPSEWVKEATAKQISNGDDPNNDWNQGYGYQFWRCRHGIYRGDGAFGQFCIIMPEQDAVIAITSATNQMDEVLNAVWDGLLPAFKEATPPLLTDSKDFDFLQNRLSSLTLEPTIYENTSPRAQEWSDITYLLEDNPLELNTFSYTLAPTSIVQTVGNAAGNHQIVYGTENWIEGKTSILRKITECIACRASWKQENILYLTLRPVETPFQINITLTFEEHNLEMSISNCIGSKSMETIIIKGSAMAEAKEA